MQIHTPSPMPAPGDFRVYLNPGAKNNPFAVINLDGEGTRIFIEDTDDADRLIKAAAQAKDLILAARTLLVPVPAGSAAAPVPDKLCQYCDVEPAIAGNYCEACAPAVQMATGGFCPAFTDIDGETVFCDREPGHPGSHHGPGPDEGSEVAWSDEAPEMCDSELPLRNGGVIKCILSDGHYGGHRALGGKRRWLGTGADARNEDGTHAAPQGCRS